MAFWGIIILFVFGFYFLYLILINNESDISEIAKRQRKIKEFISAIFTITGLFLTVRGSIQLNSDDGDSNGKKPPVTEISESTTTTINTPPVTNPDENSVNQTFIQETEQSIINPIKINPITQNILNINPIEKKEIFADNVEFVKYSGYLEYKNQIDEYSIVAPISGKYRFDISDTLSNTKITIIVLDSAGKQVAYSYSLSSNGGVTAKLEANMTYTVKIMQVSGIDNYTLTIGQPKTSINVSGCTDIHDSIEFKEQINKYSYTPTETGKYRFSFSDVKYGIKLALCINNSKGKQLDFITMMEDGYGLTEQLEANETYTIYVLQNGDFGEYTLNIGSQKEVKNITDFTKIKDCTEFQEQRNIYTYTPNVSGKYRFYFTDVLNGVNLYLSIYDDLNNQLNNNTYNIPINDGATYNLEKGKQYTIRVSQAKNYGSYTMNIGTQKDTIDITPYSSVTDNVEFQKQQNNYTFIPPVSTDYKLEFNNMHNELILETVVLNDLDYEIAENCYVDNKTVVELSNLVAGQIYTIEVMQDSKYSEYSFSIIQK